MTEERQMFPFPLAGIRTVQYSSDIRGASRHSYSSQYSLQDHQTKRRKRRCSRRKRKRTVSVSERTEKSLFRSKKAPVGGIGAIARTPDDRYRVAKITLYDCSTSIIIIIDHQPNTTPFNGGTLS